MRASPFQHAIPTFEHINEYRKRAGLAPYPSKAEFYAPPADLRRGLEELLRLARHYAMLLNMHDGGRRNIPETVEGWLGRLASCEKARPKP